MQVCYLLSASRIRSDDIRDRQLRMPTYLREVIKRLVKREGFLLTTASGGQNLCSSIIVVIHISRMWVDIPGGCSNTHFRRDVTPELSKRNKTQCKATACNIQDIKAIKTINQEKKVSKSQKSSSPQNHSPQTPKGKKNKRASQSASPFPSPPTPSAQSSPLLVASNQQPPRKPQRLSLAESCTDAFF